MKLNQDFREFIEFLNSNNVKYLLVGGWSVAIHGKPRYTKDIDFFISTDPSNARKMMNALRDFGMASLGLTETDFCETGQIIQLGIEPHRIDIITELPALDFDSAWERRLSIDIDGVLVNVISLQDLILNKEASGRPQDIADVVILRKLEGN